MQSVERTAPISNEVEAMKDEAVRLYDLGELEQARDLNLKALNRATGDLKFICTYNWAMIERGMGNYMTALSIHNLAMPLMDACTSNLYKGQFRNGLGLTYRKLGFLHKALVEYKSASEHFRLAGAWSDLKAAENNIAYLLISTGQTGEAFERLFKIRSQFEALRDFTRAAEVNDSIAQAYLEAGNLELALDHAMLSLTELRRLGEVQAAKKSKETLKKILNEG